MKNNNLYPLVQLVFLLGILISLNSCGVGKEVPVAFQLKNKNDPRSIHIPRFASVGIEAKNGDKFSYERFQRIWVVESADDTSLTISGIKTLEYDTISIEKWDYNVEKSYLEKKWQVYETLKGAVNVEGKIKKRKIAVVLFRPKEYVYYTIPYADIKSLTYARLDKDQAIDIIDTRSPNGNGGLADGLGAVVTILGFVSVESLKREKTYNMSKWQALSNNDLRARHLKTQKVNK